MKNSHYFLLEFFINISDDNRKKACKTACETVDTESQILFDREIFIRDLPQTPIAILINLYFFLTGCLLTNNFVHCNDLNINGPVHKSNVSFSPFPSPCLRYLLIKSLIGYYNFYWNVRTWIYLFLFAHLQEVKCNSY